MLKFPFLIFLPLALWAQQPEITSTFYIRNHASESVYIAKSGIFLKGAFPYVIKGKNQELFRYPGHFDRPAFIQMRFKSGHYGRNYLVYPNDTLHIYIENDIPDVKISNKSKEKEFQFINDLYYDIKESDFNGVKIISKSETLTDRDVYFKNIYKEQLDYLNRNGVKYGLSEYFKKVFRLFIFSKMVISKYERQIFRYKYASGIKNFYQREFSNYVDSFSCKELATTREYKEAAMIVANVLSKSSRASFEEINEIFPDSEIKDFLLSKYLYEGLNANDTSVNKYMEKYFAICDNPLYENKIKTLFALKNVGTKFQLNNGVSLLNAEGKRTTFSDFLKEHRGKIIYVDFWATWCGPCIKEMPYSEKLRKQFKDKDVVFLFISMDEDYLVWKDDPITKTLSGAEGNYAFENSHNTLTEMLKLSAIPRYVIIDKDGGFYKLNAPRPSEKETAQIIKKLLQ